MQIAGGLSTWFQILKERLREWTLNVPFRVQVKILLNDVIRPDPKFDLTKVQVQNMGDQVLITPEDLKMITLSTDVLNIQGTIYQLERAFSTSTQISDDEQISTVEEVTANISKYKLKNF